MTNARLVATVFLLLAAGATDAIALPIETIVIDSQKGPQKFRVEVASDQKSKEQGLMFRRYLPSNAGMIFTFSKPEMVIFWMKNTFIPLDILFVRPDGKVSSIAANAEPLSLKSIPSDEPVLAVIELNGGRARALGIKPGDRVHAPTPP